MDAVESFEVVYEHLCKWPMFVGCYDAKNGNENFMYGIGTVMETIAQVAGKEDSFNEMFFENMKKSQKKSICNIPW